jgi:N-acylglucosamine 2-epimerase
MQIQTQAKEIASLYHKELTEEILPFWVKYSPDKTHGGFFTCLDSHGQIYDTDKFIWLQGRQVWCLSFMYQNLQANPAWKELALHGAAFMERYGRDSEGNWYFSLNQAGQPLIQPYNIFSDCFAAMGFGALYGVTQKEEHAQIAKDTFQNILRRKENWKGTYNKSYPNTRPLKNFSLPMILCNLSLELEHIIGKDMLEQLIPEVIHEVMEVFYQPEIGLVLENVNANGSFSDSYEGRLLNPGHTIEAMWFIMDLGVRLNQPSLIEKAVAIMLRTLELAWDKECGGLYYFMDVCNKPLQQLEWDQKLWWVHVETLVALAKAWKLTGSEKTAVWFNRVHEYTWNHFRDPNGGEWFGYLNRRGEVLLSLKGGKWKGCFHIPRSLYQIWKTLQ